MVQPEEACVVADRVTQSYLCTDCAAHFAHLDLLLQHQREAHAHVDAVACDVCRRTFFTPDALTRHIRDVHLRPSNHHGVGASRPNPLGRPVSYRCMYPGCHLGFESRDKLQHHLQQLPQHNLTIRQLHLLQRARI